MLSNWLWISRCGDYWQQVELRTDGARRIMMMMMMPELNERYGWELSTIMITINTLLFQTINYYTITTNPYMKVSNISARSTSWLSWSVGVWRTKHQGIWSTAALQSPTSLVDIDDQPTYTAWSFRGIDAAHSVGGPSLSGSDRLEFTACQTVWTGCERRCLSVCTKDDLVREILVHQAQLRCSAWNCNI